MDINEGYLPYDTERFRYARSNGICYVLYKANNNGNFRIESGNIPIY